MLTFIKNVLEKSKMVQKIYRRFVLPIRKQHEPDIFIIRNLIFSLSIDVGANKGMYSNELSKVSKVVFAFEPLKDMFDFLNVVTRKNVVLFRMALGAKNGENEIYIPTKGDKIYYGLASIVPHDKRNKIKETIIVKKFDDVRGEMAEEVNEKIDFIKIDVEGYENDVLIGMKSSITEYHPTILVEIEKRHNENYMRVFDFLFREGYRSYITENGIDLVEIVPEDIDELQTSERYKSDIEPIYKRFARGDRKLYINNFWFIHESKNKYFANFIKK